jgi:hypothetical protein
MFSDRISHLLPVFDTSARCLIFRIDETFDFALAELIKRHNGM